MWLGQGKPLTLQNQHEGLLQVKSSGCITRGGGYSGSAKNHQDPYLKTILGFLGIEDVTFLLQKILPCLIWPKPL